MRLVSGVLSLTCGCAVPPSTQSAPRPWPPNVAVTPPASKDAPPAANSPSQEAAIAYVDGRPIPRSAVIDLLLKSHGAGLLEQLVALEAVAFEAAKLGVAIDDRDVEREFEIGLRRLNPPEEGETFDRVAAEKALSTFLAERNISNDEFAVTLRRNTYLRKIVERDLEVPPVMLDEEYARTFGEKVQVRHIQLSSMAEVNRVLGELEQGASFVELASKHSANPTSAVRGGLLSPFSKSDPETPEALRQTAFALSPGQVSSPVHVGQWFHILRLERRIGARNPPIEEVRDQLLASVRERLAEVRMRELYSQIVGRVQVTIEDPILREAYEKRNPKDRP